MSALDMAVIYSGMAAEAILIAVVWMRGIGKRLPVFTVYLTWCLVSDVAMFVVLERFQAKFMQVFPIESSLDLVMQFLVLFGLAWSAFRHLPVLVARLVLSTSIFLTLVAGWGVWQMAGWWARSDWSAEWQLTSRIQIASSLLRIFFLFMLAWLIQFLNKHFFPIGWSERDLQVATGLGIYALASMAASLAKMYHLSSTVYNGIDAAVSLSYLVALLYWLVCFLRPERPFNEPAHASGRAGSHAESADRTLDRRRLNIATRA